MLESHLRAGRQELIPGQPLEYGKSVTDACIGWEDTERALERLADAVRARRQAAPAHDGAERTHRNGTEPASQPS
jgi:3-deoxy-7-phosphoheptulonate synthase